MNDQTENDTYIETYTGKKFYFLNPLCSDIDIIDIAHSLSMQCRYTGHAKEFFSIAEHSILVAELCSDENKLWGLLHDGSEAYLTDVASPIKPFLKNYKKMEKVLMDAICTKYGLKTSMPEEVHIADMEVLRSEASKLMTSKGADWKINQNNDSPIIDLNIQCMSPFEAKIKFIEKFYDYCK